MEFPFPCIKCNKPVCRRAYTMNLALGYVDENYCLLCLSEMHDQLKGNMFDFVYGYVSSRDCFKKEWIKMKSKDECPLQNDCVVDKCFT